MTTNNWDALYDIFIELSYKHPTTAYFELSAQRRTAFMGFLCSDLIDNDPSRKIYANSNGDKGGRTLNLLIKNYCHYKKQILPNKLRVDKTLSKLCSYESILRNTYGIHYVEFMLSANPLNGFTFTVYTHYDYKRKTTKELINISSKCHRQILTLSIIAIKELIKNLTSGKVQLY